jgi:hypothetical protein
MQQPQETILEFQVHLKILQGNYRLGTNVQQMDKF